MSTKIRKIALITFIICLFSTVTAFASEYKDPDSGYYAVIEDDADLLTDEQEAQLLETMKGGLAYGHLMFKSIDFDAGTSTQNYNEQLYYQKFGNQSGTLFIIDMYQRQMIISSDGANYDTITVAKANVITDNNYRYATDGDYFACANGCFEQIIALLNGQRINEPMKHISNAILAILVGLMACAGIVFATMGVKKASMNDVLTMAKNTVKPANVKIEHTSQTKTYSPIIIVSGGSGGGGGGGGGFSGGGGGGGGGGGFSGGSGGHGF